MAYLSLADQDGIIGANSQISGMTDSPPTKAQGSEISSSGDETILKIRKPYTITKQRERWTEEEHKKFLESLKMYGRAWRRIEEHIGTKSAIQIRSHAQKFFTKILQLEREASASGMPMGKAHNINIPPPRPKRKPSNPYPRKAGTSLESGSSTIHQGSRSTEAVSFALHQILGGPGLGDESHKNTFTTYDSRAILLATSENISLQEKKVEVASMNSHSSSVRLFGQTVSVPITQRGKATTAKPSLGNNLQDAFQERTSVRHEISSLEYLTPEDQRLENGQRAFLPGTKAQAKLQDESAMPKSGYPSEPALNILPSESGISMVKASSGMNVDESCMRKMPGLRNSEDQADEQPSAELYTSPDHLSGKHQDHAIVSGYPRQVPVQHVVDGGIAKSIHELSKNGPNVSCPVHQLAATSTLTNDNSLFNVSGYSLMDIPSSSHSLYFPQLPCMAGPYNPCCNNVENFGHIKGFMNPRIASNSSFMQWHLLQMAALQHSTAYAAAALPAASPQGLVLGADRETTAEPLRPNESMNAAFPWDKVNSAVSLAVATAAAASAWWALHGTVLPSFLQPGIYGPIPAATAATSSANPSSVCKPEPVIGAREQKQINATKGDAKSLDATPVICDVETEGNVTALQHLHDPNPFNPEGSANTHSDPANCMPQGSLSDSENDTSCCLRDFCVAEAWVNKKSSENEEHNQKASSTNSLSEERMKIRRQLDRSSCDSNTPSSSDLEMDPYLGTNVEWFRGDNRKLDFTGLGSGASETKEEDTTTEEEEMRGKILLDKAQRLDFSSKDEGREKAEKHIHKDGCHSVGEEAATHRSKGCGNMNDTWKEVSEEGRIAFRALFARKVLPQSFPLPHHPRNHMHPDFKLKKHEGIKQHPRIHSKDKMPMDIQHNMANRNQAHNDNDVRKEVVPSPKTDGEDPASHSWEKKISDSEVMVSNQSLHTCTQINLGKSAKLMSDSSFQNSQSGQAGFVPYKRHSIGAKVNRPLTCSMENSEEHIREVKKICLEQEVNK